MALPDKLVDSLFCSPVTTKLNSALAEVPDNEYRSGSLGGRIRAKISSRG
jgi:hypothetical protein